MPFDPNTGLFIKELPPPECEYTAPGSTTEALDCWQVATLRHVQLGRTIGVYCEEHSEQVATPDVTVEDMND